MTITTALIAEDEPLLAAGLRADLARLWPELQVVAEAGDGQQALDAALALKPQVCFLDIRMPGLSGLEVAQALAEDWPEQEPFPMLVFVTAYDQYALQAFEREATDYLLKPVDAARLGACVERLRRQLAQRSGNSSSSTSGDTVKAVDSLRALLGALAPASDASERLEVIQAGVGHQLFMVPVDEVVYFEAADKYLRVVTADKEHVIRMSLRELLPRLDSKRFWQVHRGTVVQARCIASAARDEAGKISLSLRGRPEKLGVSRLYAHLFRAM